MPPQTQTAVTERAMFLELGAERLFAFLHRPATATRGVVLCTPLAEEKLWSHRVFVSFARELAARGYAVLRFDFRGEGDSDRSFEDTDLETRVEDTAFAVESLKALVPGITDLTLVGLRLGAAIAALTAARRQDVQRLVLWDPVTNGDDYMQAVLRSNLMYQMALHRKVIENREALVERLRRGETIHVEGYELSEPLFRQVSGFRLADVLSATSVACQMVSLAAREAPPREELSSLASSQQSITVSSVIEEPFWREIKTFYQRADNLFEATLGWLGAAS